MQVDKIRTIKLLSKWSFNRIASRRLPLVAVFSLTHYCNFYCPMCPFGDSNKEGQLKLVNERDLSTEQWKRIFDKVSKYCVWAIIEGGEPTSRPDFIELVSYLNSINIPTSLITNCSLLHTVDLEKLRRHVQFVTCSIDSVYEEAYCKIRGVSSKIYQKVIENIGLLNQSNISHYFNSVITKFNTDEFIDQSYFDKSRDLGSNAVSLTFVEDRADVPYSLLPDRKIMNKVCESILDHVKKKSSPQIMIPPEYFEQILEYGRTNFDECGVWKSTFVNADGTVMVPCWKFNKPENTYNLLERSIEDIWSAPQWDIAKSCHDCQVLGCIWYSSQPISTFAKNYLNGLSRIINQHKPELLPMN